MADADKETSVTQLKVKRLNLGAISQMDIQGSRPPACTLFAALAADFIAQNLAEVVKRFLDEDVDYFKKMHSDVYDNGVPIYAHAQASNITSILDGRIDPDELATHLPDRFGSFIISSKMWVSGNPALSDPLTVFESIGQVFKSTENTTRITFIVADAETFVLVDSGQPDRCFYFNSHKTGLVSDDGKRATEFGVMDTDSIYSFLTLQMHGNQPCNSVDFMHCDLPKQE